MNHGAKSKDLGGPGARTASLEPSCNHCGEAFAGLIQLKDHVQESHPGLVGSPWWEELLAHLRESTHTSIIESQPKSDDGNSMDLNVGGDALPSISREGSAAGPIGSFGQLSLGQARNPADVGGTGQVQGSPNPRKRPATDNGNAVNRARIAKSGPQFTSGDPEPGASVNSKREKRPVNIQQANIQQERKAPAQRSSQNSADNKQRPLYKQPTAVPPPKPNQGQQASQDYNARKPNEETCLLQAECQPISLEQLIVEVKGIYAGLVMVEAKCIDIDDKQTIAALEKDPDKRTNLTPEQWGALIALHKTLLHEHHDFFLASQHPVASPALSRLAAKYSMPARMWRHGIHAFLEVLRHRLPESLDHMLTFIYIAYSMMALLYETVPSFEDTWIECLGDLGRYRMAIEDDDIRDREVWSGVARFWYRKAADKNPKIGRLYHHLAILARPYTIQQLSFYTRSLTCITPFESASASIMTLFGPVIDNQESVLQRSNNLEIAFIKLHALIFTRKNPEEFRSVLYKFIEGDLLSQYISRAGSKFKEVGAYSAQANIAALLGYGALTAKGTPRGILRVLLEQERIRRGEAAVPPKDNSEDEEQAEETQYHKPAPSLQDLTDGERALSERSLSDASQLFYGTLSVALRRPNDKNVYPLVHLCMVFLSHLVSTPEAMDYAQDAIPWVDLVSFLNFNIGVTTTTIKVLRSSFPNKPSRPLPEDYWLRGQIFAEYWFPAMFFENAGLDDEERSLELPSMHAPRVDRILYAAYKIVACNKYIQFDEATGRFAETSYVKELVGRHAKHASDSTPAPKEEDTVMSGTGQVQLPGEHLTDSPQTSAAGVTTPHTDMDSSQTLGGMRIEDDNADTRAIKQESLSPPAYQNDRATEEWLNSSRSEEKSPMKIDAEAGDRESGQLHVVQMADDDDTEDQA